jgi:glycerophosphoryl diester phosphodiesterase
MRSTLCLGSAAGLLAASLLTVADLRAGAAVRVELHAHRGGAGLAPENTLAAFRRALELGADVLELDLQVTRDGEVVVFHDETLDRTTDGRGPVRDRTLEELRRLDAGGKFHARFAGERIPTLRDVLALVGATGDARARLNLETKFAKGREGAPADFEERILAVLRETAFLHRVILQSFHHPSLERVRRLEPGIPLAVLVGGNLPPSDPVSRVRAVGAHYYSPNFRQVGSTLVATLHAAGIPIVPWTVNEASDAEKLLQAGLGRMAGDGFITDFPDRMLRLVRAP